MNNSRCYFIYDGRGVAKALLHSQSAATIIADGHGSWKALPDGSVGYVMQSARSLTMGHPGRKMNVYLYKGDYLVETDEQPW